MAKSKTRRRLKTPTILKNLFALAAVGLSLTACASQPVPVWNGRLFFGSQADGGVVRRSAIDADFISCGNPLDRERFDDLVCMSSADFKSFANTYIGGCEKWKSRKGSILVDPVVLRELIAGTRRLEELDPTEYEVIE